MNVTELSASVALDARDGEPVVVIAPAGARDALARCLRGVLRHTSADVPVVVTVASGDEATVAWLRELAGDDGPSAHTLHVLPADGAAPVAWRRAAALTGRADLVLVHADTTVGPGWLDGLRVALAVDDAAATATPLSNHAAFASVPRRNLPWTLLPPDLALDDAAERLRAQAAPVHPRLPTALGHCALVARRALDVTGPFDATPATADDALADLSHRATACGMRHVLADDVLVEHRGAAAGAAGARDTSPGMAARHPHAAAARAEAAEDRWSALARAVGAAGRTLTGGTTTIDARGLTPGPNGVKRAMLELIGALHRADRTRLRVVLPGTPGDEAVAALRALSGLELIGAGDVGEGIARSDVVHRPWQVDTPADLALLDLLGERLVLTHHDLIAYRNPGVFAVVEAWLDHRRVTATALSQAALVMFPSGHAAADALADDLLDASRVRVVPNGVDHRMLAPGAGTPSAPAGVAPGGGPFLLCLGSHLRHKNLPFALRLLAALRERHGWEGRLVLAGAEPVAGSSSGDEAALLLEHPELAEHVLTLGAVSEDERAWLQAEAAAVLYPSVVEGFGLIPFEAAAAGTPCLWAAVTAQGELLDEAAATLVPWDAAQSADRVIAVLRDEARAGAIVASVRAASERLTWDAAAAAVLDAYDDAVRLPAPPAARAAARATAVETAYWGQRDALTATAYALVGPEAPLLDADEQRRLATLATQPRGRRALRAFLRVGARLQR